MQHHTVLYKQLGWNYLLLKIKPNNAIRTYQQSKTKAGRNGIYYSCFKGRKTIIYLTFSSYVDNSNLFNGKPFRIVFLWIIFRHDLQTFAFWCHCNSYDAILICLRRFLIPTKRICPSYHRLLFITFFFNRQIDFTRNR